MFSISRQTEGATIRSSIITLQVVEIIRAIMIDAKNQCPPEETSFSKTTSETFVNIELFIINIRSI